jgi:geranylgeranyl diphosphate synthase type II
MNPLEYKTIFENFLEKNLPKVIPNNLYEPYHYILHLDGKRIRPVLMMAAHACYKPLSDELMTAALAVELFHNFSLMHDDIMDKSDLRRGYPTVHKKFGENSAILSGDAMLILSYQLLERITDPRHFKEVYQLYNKTAVEICIGQQLDMNYENEVIISELEYLMMIEHKTAVLLAASMKMGAILADADANEKNHFYDFGLNIGLAFQIQDDLLDSFGLESITGKKVGGDICNNKKTLLFIYALQNAHKTQKELLYNWIQTKEVSHHKIEEVSKIFVDSGSREYTTAKRNSYYQMALASLEKMSISADHKDFLITFANKAVDREK